MISVPANTNVDRTTLAWAFAFVYDHARGLSLVLALALVTTAATTAQPWVLKLIIDDGLLAGDFPHLLSLVGVMLALGLINLLFGGLNRYAHVAVSGRILFAIRETVYRHLQCLSPEFFARTRTGDVLQRLDGDVAQVQRFCVDSLLAGINGVLGFCGAVALMVWLSWQLSLIAFVLLPLDLLYLRFMRPRVEVRSRRMRERASDLSAFLVETLPAMKFIQSVGAEDREFDRLHRLNRGYLTDLLRLQVTEFLTAAVPNLFTSVSRGAVFVAGGWLIIEGRMTLGTLIAFSTYLGYAVGPVHSLLGIYVGAVRARVSLDRVRVLTEAMPVVADPPEPVPLPSTATGAIEISDVAFAYPGAEISVLRNASLAITGGSKVALVGASGAGKTTLVDLLQRHFDPISGTICLDGIDLHAMSLADLRRSVAVVAQDVVLFRGSLADNIRYAVPDADMNAVRDVVRRAQLDAFVENLPQGLDTPIGEHGANLSGGQRQRLSIARALLQDPLVLIMDEATSAVDRDTEMRLISQVDTLFAGRTRIVISHRAETLAGADRAVEVADGRFREVDYIKGPTSVS